MTEITVITTTHGKRREKLERAVNSIINQTFKDWELIISDDASTDDTEAYYHSLTDERINYYKRKKNWGNQTRPINSVLPMARGRYIAFLDSDNEYLPDHLQLLYKAIKESDVDLVYGDRFFIDDTGKIPTQIGVFHDFAPHLLLERNYIDMSDFLVKKECIEYVGGMDERYKRYSDWNLLVRLAKAGYEFKRVPVVITNYHYHSESLSARVIENKEHPDKPLWNSYELDVRLPYLGKILEPKVAVYTLTMNRLEYTKKCFDELKKTAGYKFDHFVVDQGSTDGTQNYLMHEYKPYRLIRNKENVGISIGSNQAVDEMDNNYDIIIKIDNDAMPLSMGWLKDFVELYKKNHKMVWSPYIEGLKDNPGGAPRVGYGYLNGHLIGITNHLGGIFNVAPREAYKKWRWDESDPRHGLQDLLFSQYLTKNGWGLAYVEDIRVSHGPTGTEGQYKDYPEYFEKRKLDKEDPNSKEHWDRVYKDEDESDPNFRNDVFSFNIIKKELETLPKGKILDFGCGSGYLLEYLKDFNDLYGVDLSDEGLKTAEKRNPNAKLKQGNVYELPYKESEFDIVVSTEVLEHLQDIKKAVSQINRVLKDGGVSINLLPYKNTIYSLEHVAEYDEKKIKEVFGMFSDVETRVYSHPTGSKLLFVKAIK